MRSYSKPTSDQVQAALPLLSSPQHEAYFFSRLENPYWIVPLAERNLFRDPPPPEQVEGGGVRFPPWAASRYLARMASQSPEDVAAVLRGIETENAAILADIVDAALAMPPEIATSLVPVISNAAREHRLWYAFDKASSLCAYLAEKGEADAALELAQALFAPSFERDDAEPRHLDEYSYDEGLARVVPALAKVRPREILMLLCDWLQEAVEAREDIVPGSDSDASSFWRPAVEEHSQNSHYEFASTMVGFVRLGFEETIREESLSLEEAFRVLEGYQFLIFNRIRLHLIGEFSEANRELAIKTMMDRDLFHDFRFKHEYARLVGQRLELLAPEQRAEWFSWIDSGPDLAGYEKRVQRDKGRQPTDEERLARLHWWQFERLHCVRSYLEGEREAFYLRMVGEHGEPDMADLNVRVGPVRWGDESPVTIEELASRGFEEAVEFVSLWRQGSILGPSIEGLASTFGQYVATNPENLSEKAHVLFGRPEIFARHFIQEIAEAVKAGKRIALPSVLDLCEWVVKQPTSGVALEDNDYGGLVETSWQWARDEVTRFLENVFKAKSEGKPRYSMDGLRPRLWKLIAALTRSPAKSYIIRDTTKEDPRVHDYLELGLNSPRGKAVGTVLEYAGWIANHLRLSVGGETVPGGFEAMPEVQAELEWQIAPGNGSVETSAIIGAHIGLVYWIDRDWLTGNAGALFRLEGVDEGPVAPEGWAAWNAFLVWVKPHVEFYRLFEKQFSCAVEHAARVELPESGRHQPMNHLGEHLMILYARGEITFDSGGGILQRFLETANANVRRHSIGFLGRIVRGDEELAEDVVERLMLLWDRYWTGPGRKDAEEKPEAQLFGTWFLCDQFPGEWRLDRLEDFSKATQRVEPDHEVLGHLAEVARTDIGASVRILDRVVRGDREGWRIHMRREAITALLRQALSVGGDTRVQAEAIVNYLGRRGYIEFGEILEER